MEVYYLPLIITVFTFFGFIIWAIVISLRQIREAKSKNPNPSPVEMAIRKKKIAYILTGASVVLILLNAVEYIMQAGD